MVGLSAAGAAPYVQAFDSLLAGPVAEYLKISKEIGGDVQKHVRMFGPFSPLLKGLMASSNPNHPWFKSPLQGSWLLSSQLLPRVQSRHWNRCSDFSRPPAFIM